MIVNLILCLGFMGFWVAVAFFIMWCVYAHD